MNQDRELEEKINELKLNYSAKKSVLKFKPNAKVKQDMRVASIMDDEILLGVGWDEDGAWRDAAYRLGLTNE